MSRDDKIDLILNKVMKLDNMETQIETINTKLSALTTTVTTIQATVETHTSDIAELRSQLDEQKAEIRTLKTSHHRREMRLRANTVRLFNFPYCVGESLENFKSLSAKVYDRVIKPTLVAAKAAGDLGSVPQQQTAIESCFRIYRQSGDDITRLPPPPVVIRLTSHNIKVAVMKNRRCVPPPSDGEKKDGLRNFTLVEDLTPEAFSLLRALQQDDRTHKVWSVNGIIHFTKPGGSGYSRVKNVFDSVDSILGET